MNIKYDKYTDKYFLSFTESNVVALSFGEVEEMLGQLQQVCTDKYSSDLEAMFTGGDDCESGACKI